MLYIYTYIYIDCSSNQPYELPKQFAGLILYVRILAIGFVKPDLNPKPP